MVSSSPCCASLLVLLLACGADGYFYHVQRECRYSVSSKGVQDAEFIDRYYFNKLEFLRYNSTLNKYIGYTEHGVRNAERLNKDPAELAGQLSNRDGTCKPNAELYYSHILDKTAEPDVRLSSTKPSSQKHPAMLMCSALGFYPRQIKVSWLRDGQTVTSDVTSTEELADGDWYYQIHSHLEYTPRAGESIVCRVEHSSFATPKELTWDPSMPEADRNKIIIGASGLVLGLVIAAAGGIYYKKKSGVRRMLVPTS
ncbi:rano class II histocompatibility antigen, A beta chain-like [Lepisosteus oculatus]|uniref:rano class II histocompatibility antigen, A beta chain-like n=1 Tax=Lepisosteus oculatus TaxID=7918 RepID=UPI0035F51DB2